MLDSRITLEREIPPDAAPGTDLFGTWVVVIS